MKCKRVMLNVNLSIGVPPSRQSGKLLELPNVAFYGVVGSNPGTRNCRGNTCSPSSFLYCLANHMNQLNLAQLEMETFVCVIRQ